MSRNFLRIGIPAVAVLGAAVLVLTKTGILHWSKDQSGSRLATSESQVPHDITSAVEAPETVVERAAPDGGAVAAEAEAPVADDPKEDGPLEMYLANIAKARNGNPRSQYRVSQALQKCRMAPKTEEQLGKALATVSMSVEQTAEIKRRYMMCKDFVDLAPEIDAEIAEWLHLAAEGGDPLAKGYEALLSFPNVESVEIKSSIREALRTGESEAHSLAAMYYANVTPNDNAELYEAWLLISCTSNADCDVARERERIKLQYRMFERLQISSFESDLRKKLEARQWDQLGF